MIAHRYQRAITAVIEDLGGTIGAVGGDHGGSGCQRFCQDVAESLQAGGENKQVSLPHPGVRIVHEAGKIHIIVDLQLPCQGFQCLFLPPLAKDDQPATELFPQQGKTTDQGGEILAGGELTDTQDDGGGVLL